MRWLDGITDSKDMSLSELQDREGVMQTADSLQKTLMLGEIEGGRRRG